MPRNPSLFERGDVIAQIGLDFIAEKWDTAKSHLVVMQVNGGMPCGPFSVRRRTHDADFWRKLHPL
jgi:hypothetical protein